MTLARTTLNGVPVMDDPKPTGEAFRFTSDLADNVANHRGAVRVAEDYTDADVGDKIMAAVDDLPNSGGTVLLPYGEYDYSSTILITKNGVRITGSGMPSRYPNDDIPGTQLNYQGTTGNGITLGDGVSRTNGLCLEKFMLDCPLITTGHAIEAKTLTVQASLKDLYIRGRDSKSVSGFSDNLDGKTQVACIGHNMSNGDTVVFSSSCAVYRSQWVVEQVTTNTFVINTPYTATQTTWAYPKLGTGLYINTPTCISWMVENVYVKGFYTGVDILGGHHACVYRNCWFSGNMVGVRTAGGAMILFIGGENSAYFYGDFIGFELLDEGPITISDVYSETAMDGITYPGANARFVVVGDAGVAGNKPSSVTIRDCFVNGFTSDYAIEINRCYSFRLVGGVYDGPWTALVKNNATSVGGITIKPGWIGSGQTLINTTTGVCEMRNSEDGITSYPNLPVLDPGVAGQLWNSAGTVKVSI